MLTAAQQLHRQFKVTASMMPIIMGNNATTLQRLYMEAIGDAEREPSNYAMQLGHHVEHFLLNYWEKKHGHPITRRGEVVDHPTLRDVACTVDGYRAFDDAMIETKFLSPWRKPEEFFPYYYPQVLFQMRCCNAQHGTLLVGQGTNEPVDFEIIPDAEYEAEMWRRVAAFQLCLQTLTPPIPLKQMIPPEKWRTIDLTVTDAPLPNWAFALIPALRLLEDTREAADMHIQSSADAREMVPDDVGLVLTPEHRIARNKKGTLVITRRAA